MPRYRYESPFERVFTGLSVGVDGVTVHPADGRPQPPDGSTVVLDFGDELATAAPFDGYGLVPADEPADTPAPDTTTPGTPATEETPQP